MKYITAVLLIAILSLGVYIRYKDYFNPTGVLLTPGKLITIETPSASTISQKEVAYKAEEYVRGLKVPWRIVFTSQSRVLVTEREGQIRAIINGTLQDKPLITFPKVSHSGEEGLLGMTLDPEYETNRYLYVVVSYTKNGKVYQKVVRLKDLETELIEDKNIIEDIPAAEFHDGGHMRFGPDKKLYISTGDALNKQNAQDKSSLSGKILRINSDGSIPNDNPFLNSPVWSYGHRNSQGFDWYPQSMIMFETEHGPSIIDGPAGGDEVNVIEIGENYGWPVAHHDIRKEGMIDPKILFTPAFAPASGVFYTGKVFPQFYGNFLFGGLKGEGIIRVVVDPSSPTKVISYGKLDGINVGRIRDVEVGVDGYIYFTTSNRDGRGTPNEGDDKIYRLVPQSKK